MNIPCKFNSPCIDPANPLANTSAELPDQDLFIGYNSNWAGLPPIDSLWTSTGCKSQCVSPISQEDADICSANQQVQCTTTDNNEGGPDDPGWHKPPTGDPYTLFGNDAESCTVNCPDGLPFTFTFPANKIVGLNKAQIDAAAKTFACEDARAHRVCLSVLSQTEACLNTNYSATITASGGSVSSIANLWTNTGGDLPPGITMSFGFGGSVLTLSGKPTAVGSYSFAITIQTPAGDFMTKTYAICVINITPASLPDATVGTDYTAQLQATACANQSQSWQIVSANLPPGLVLNEQTGQITGNPTGPVGTFTLRVRFQDNAT